MDLNSFLVKHRAENIHVIDGQTFVGEIFRHAHAKYRLAGFDAPLDTGLYSRLLSKALELVSPNGLTTLLDLGAGSSIPTLSALIANPRHSQLKVIAVDLDPAALDASIDNTNSLGLRDRYVFLRGNMLSPKMSAEITNNTMICSNPPYLPAPAGLETRRFRSVDGGEDGTAFIERLLRLPKICGTKLAISWSSLSNPCKVIDLIETNFDVLYAQYAKAQFGAYTSSPEFFPHLFWQRERGLAVFSTDEAGNNFYQVIGTVLVRN